MEVDIYSRDQWARRNDYLSMLDGRTLSAEKWESMFSLRDIPLPVVNIDPVTMNFQAEAIDLNELAADILIVRSEPRWWPWALGLVLAPVGAYGIFRIWCLTHLQNIGLPMPH